MSRSAPPPSSPLERLAAWCDLPHDPAWPQRGDVRLFSYFDADRMGRCWVFEVDLMGTTREEAAVDPHALLRTDAQIALWHVADGSFRGVCSLPLLESLISVFLDWAGPMAVALPSPGVSDPP